MKKLWKKIQGFFILVFGGAQKFEKFLIEHADDAIEIVTKIKAAVENPLIVTIINILPEKYKSTIGQVRTRIENVLTKVLADLVISDQCLQLPTLTERLRCFVDHLSKQPPAIQEALYFKFASLYTKYSLNENGVKGKIIDTAVQMRFLEQSENLV
jgi:hypothetical protein